MQQPQPNYDHSNQQISRDFDAFQSQTEIQQLITDGLRISKVLDECNKVSYEVTGKLEDMEFNKDFS